VKWSLSQQKEKQLLLVRVDREIFKTSDITRLISSSKIAFVYSMAEPFQLARPVEAYFKFTTFLEFRSSLI